MADELPPAVAKFIADVSRWVGPLEEAKNSVNDWKNAVDDASKSIDDNMTKSMDNLDKSVGDAAEDAGRDIGDKLGGAITDETAKKLDEDKEKVADSAGRVGIHGAETFARDFSSRLSSLASGIFGGGGGGFFSNLMSGIGPAILGLGGLLKSKMALIVAGIGAALSVLPAVAGIAAAGMGVALIGGLVAVSAALNTKVKAAFKGVGKTAESTLETAFKPLVPIFLQIAKAADQLMKAIGPGLSDIFKTIGPTLIPIFNQISAIVKLLIDVMKTAAPAFGPFITAILSIVRNLLTGLLPAIRAIIPLIGSMGSMGKVLGQFFADAAPAMKASVTVLHALANIIDAVLPVLMKFGGVLATALVPVITSLGKSLEDLTPAFTIIAKLIGSLASAMLGDIITAFTAFAQLIKAISPGLAAFAGALSGIFSVLENAGVFAILGDAVEALVKPLGKLINELLSGLAPILPVIIKAISQLSGVAIAGLIKIIEPLIPAITKLVTAGMDALAAVLPIIIPLITSFATVFTIGLADAIAAIATALAKIVNAIPPGVLTVLVGGLLGVVGAMKAMALVSSISGGMGFLTSLRMIGPIVQATTVAVGELMAKTAAMAAAFAVESAIVIAGWLASAAAATAAFIAENAATLGIAAVVLLLVSAIVYLAIHWKQVFSDIKNWTEDTFNWIRDHWKLLIAIILGPLGLIIDALVTHWNAVKHGFEDAWNYVYNTVLKPIIGFIKDYITANLAIIEKIWKTTWDAVKTVVETVWNWIKPFVETEVNGIKVILEWFEKLGDLFKGWWMAAYNAVVSVVSTMLTFVGSIGSKILHALGDVGSLLYNAGKAIIQGLINGITSMFGAISHTISSVASKVAGFFGLSPAKEGPLSAGGAPFIRGLHFAMDIAQGIEAGRIAASSAAARLAASITGAVGPTSLGAIQSQASYTAGVSAGASAGGGGGPGGDLVINVDGQRLFTILQQQLYRYNIRNSGVATGIFKPA